MLLLYTGLFIVAGGLSIEKDTALHRKIVGLGKLTSLQ
ncbi:hypothetical protein BIW11_14279 [Tropilaelaps mercedesae]|uniref:Uncharacterized protein n=1 Tax=Tropilaelaps mercedesae TaxID=418985 RepID=A0A1V9WYD4_9ACAR|nr:hypothetical protein BIW11_14279 [Tropilaelaps mercedesae]